MMAPMELVAEWERELDKHAQYLPCDLVNETIATLRGYVSNAATAGNREAANVAGSGGLKPNAPAAAAPRSLHDVVPLKMAEIRECFEFWRSYSMMNEPGQDDIAADKDAMLARMQGWGYYERGISRERSSDG